MHTQGYSKLQIAVQTGISRNTLKKYIKEFTSSKLTFDEISSLNDKDLEDLFVKPEDKPVNEKLQTLFNLFPTIDKELKKKGVTRQILWEEYKRNPEFDSHGGIKTLQRSRDKGFIFKKLKM